MQTRLATLCSATRGSALRVLLLLLATFALRAEDLPFRTWTATNGKQAEGRAFGRGETTVSLEMKDGRRIQMPLATLVEEDRKYVEGAFPPQIPSGATVAAPAAAPAAATPGSDAKPAGASQGLEGIPAVPGKVSARIACEKSPEFGYFLWLPPDIDPSRRWPVMYVMDPGGGKAGTANRYVKGATFNGFILAVSAESSNGFKDSEKAVKAMVADVNARLPIDPARQYASGFSGGSRMAGWIGSEMSRIPMAGVLCCGAGPGYGEIYRLSAKTALYGLCGSNCFNRWDMPGVFAKQPCRDKRLRFFVGRHDWGDDELIRDAMIWLNACTLSASVGRDTSLRAETDAFVAKVLAEAGSLAGTAPIRAFELAELGTRFTVMSATVTELRTLHSRLKSDPAVVKELAALGDEDKFVARHFGSGFDYRQGADPKASKAAIKLAEAHAGSSREAVLRKMAEPCVKP